ncbi:MAG: hypothetical protein RL129_96 [Actinomycetota bacterium]|jgi:UDP-glucose 4-epimerase
MTSKNRVAVTGGAGFIGSHLVETLVLNGYYVVIIDNLSNGNLANLKNVDENRFEFHNLDIRNDELVDVLNDVEILFHLAGIGDVIPSIKNPELYFETNTLGSVKVFNACKNANVKRIVYASSSSCYGNAITPTNENAKISLLHPYAASKYFGEQSMFSLGKIYGIPVISICIFNAYGRRFKTSGAYGSVIGVFLKQALENKQLTIAGDGMQARDFVHVSDVASAFLSAAKKGQQFTRYNIGYGESVTVKQLANLISERQIYIPDRLGEARETLCDNSQARKDLEWYPKVQFESGLEELLNFLNEWESAPLWTVDNIIGEVTNWNTLLSRGLQNG